MEDNVRKPAVANLFYPGDKMNLKKLINSFFMNVPPEETDFFKKNNIENPLGFIVPHAGYFYSGQVAAYAYSTVKQKAIDTVILIGPSHRHIFEGFALTHFGTFSTPLGEISVDKSFNESLIQKAPKSFHYLDTAHIEEHSLEVQLPFLQSVMINNFQIVPILMGNQTMDTAAAGAQALSEMLSKYEKSFLFVISTDLSHYLPDELAREIDEKYIELVEKGDARRLMKSVDAGDTKACGAGPTATFLETAKLLNRTDRRIQIYKNSGDASGEKDRVVGYMSAVFW